MWMIRLSSATTRRRLVRGPPYFSTLDRESNGRRGKRSTAKIKGANGWSMISIVVGCMIDGFSGFFLATDGFRVLANGVSSDLGSVR